jgi:hypothetical protein
MHDGVPQGTAAQSEPRLAPLYIIIISLSRHYY